MSGMSIARFVQIARQSEDGDIRMNSGSERRLVNKGTLENRLGTLLKMGDEETRGDRTQAALEKFREALSDRYGEDIAEKALGQAFQLNERDIKDGLNGYVVIEAARQAKELATNNRLTNRQILEDRTLDSGHEDVDTAFNERFKQSVEARSLFFEQELLDFEVSQLEEEIKTQVCGLKDNDRLEQSTEARQALSDALQGVLVAIASRRTSCWKS